MPTNVTAEYIAAEEKYKKARTIDEKILALKDMLSKCPDHKGCEKLRQDIKKRLAKLKEKKAKETEKKTKGKGVSIKKEGAATICLIGPPNSGKSFLLNKLTNSKVKVADYPFTTEKPEVGIMKYKGLKIQVIEIPAIFEGYSDSEKGPQFLSVLRQADLVLIVTEDQELDFLFDELKKANILINRPASNSSITCLRGMIVINKKGINTKIPESTRYPDFDEISISFLDTNEIEDLKDKIWKHLNLIKVYTKEPGKKVKKDEPLCLKKGSTIEDLAVYIHKDFIKKFRFARIWGSSAKFSSQRVGLKHKLEDDDIVELHLR